jgi:L-lactate utilization protein LutC
MLLHNLLEKDAQVIGQYAAALASNLTAPIHEVLEHQHKQMMIVHERLRAMERPNDQHLLVRLFEHVEDAQTAIKKMADAGVSGSDISMTLVDNIDIYQGQDKQTGWSVRETILTSGLLGLLAGALLGGVFAIG